DAALSLLLGFPASLGDLALDLAVDGLLELRHLLARLVLALLQGAGLAAEPVGRGVARLVLGVGPRLVGGLGLGFGALGALLGLLDHLLAGLALLLELAAEALDLGLELALCLGPDGLGGDPDSLLRLGAKRLLLLREAAVGVLLHPGDR